MELLILFQPAIESPLNLSIREQIFIEGQVSSGDQKQISTRVINDLQHFADFAEQENDPANARRYHVERVARCPDNQTVWFVVSFRSSSI